MEDELRKTEEKSEEEEAVKAQAAEARSRWAGRDNQSREMSRVPRSLHQPPRSDAWQAWWMAARGEQIPLGGKGESAKRRAAGGQW